MSLCDVLDVLFIEVAKFLPNLVKTGQNLRERHRFLKIQDGGSRHVEFRLLGSHRYHRHVVIRSHNILTKFGEIDTKMRERHQFFKIQVGGSCHVGFRLSGVFRYPICVVFGSRNIPSKFGENWS